MWKPPFPLDTNMPYIDVEKDTGPFVKALIDAPAPTQVLAVSEWATAREWLALWSQVTAVGTRVEQADAEEFENNDPTGFMRSILETGRFVGELGFTGGDEKILMPHDVSLAPRPSQSLDKRGVDKYRSYKSTTSSWLRASSWIICRAKIGLRLSGDLDVVFSLMTATGFVGKI